MNDAQGGIQIQSATKNQKIRVFPKALRNASLVLAFGSIAIASAHAGPKCYKCPKGQMVESAKDCPDPAFLGVDQQPKKSLAVRRVQETKLEISSA